MKLHVLGSGSDGNGYILESKEDALVIEAGVHIKHLKQALKFNIFKVSGVICSHAHLDHSGYAKQYQQSGLKVYSDWELRDYKIGSFTVKPFELVHDVTNHGFLIHHAEMGTAVFITDTHYMPHKLPAVNQYMVECNFQKEYLDENISRGHLPLMLRKRVMHSHMELGTVKRIFLENDMSTVNNIVLIHLSSGNANPVEIAGEIRDTTGKQVHVAKAGMCIDFNKDF